MSLIADFLARYRKEYDFYDQAARLAAQLLEGNLQAAGIRCMVTARAKSVSRLEAKVRERSAGRDYASLENIYDDIVDLAGVRVALYFPGERVQVDSTVKALFHLVVPPKEFPTGSTAKYAKRFSGYWATHYRVQLREAALSDAQKRYGEARVEIQVASVLMHAWAEVEHDLVYKPLQGELSESEYSILDELNGLVMAGEIALERLQRAGEARIATGEREFSNHFDLAANLLAEAGPIPSGSAADTALGRVDLLFELLKQVGLATPSQLQPYVAALHGDIERRPLADQIIDQLLAEDDTRYKIYEDIRTNRPTPGDSEPPQPDEERRTIDKALGFFVAQWIAFERAVRRITFQRGYNPTAPFPSFRMLDKLGVLDERTRKEVEFIRRMRNNVVHGIETPDSVSLEDAGERIQAITAALNSNPPVDP